MTDRPDRRLATRDWTSTPNELRERKNHLITVTDEAWTRLGRLAKAVKLSKSKLLESLVERAWGER